VGIKGSIIQIIVALLLLTVSLHCGHLVAGMSGWERTFLVGLP